MLKQSCRNRATCVDTAATKEGYVCRCGDGYHGNQCQSKVPPATSCDALQSSMTANTAENTSTETVTSTTGIGPAISTSSFTVSGLTTSDLDLEQQTSRPVTVFLLNLRVTCNLVSPSESLEDNDLLRLATEMSCPATEPDLDYCAADPCDR